MKKLFLALCCLGSASAAQPADVIREFSASMNLTREAQAACTRTRQTLAASWYPVVPDAKVKLIDVFSYAQDLGVGTNKSLVDISAAATGLKPYNAWESNVRIYTHPETPLYAYVIALEATQSSNEFLEKTAVCIALAGIRP